MTRFEKLKEMTVDEVADWMWLHVDCPACPTQSECKKYQGTNIFHKTCPAFMKEYLESEAEPENEVCTSCAIDFGDIEKEKENV